MNILTPTLAPSTTIPPDPDRNNGIPTAGAALAADAFTALVEVAILALPDAARAIPVGDLNDADPVVEQGGESLLKTDRGVPGIVPALFFLGDVQPPDDDDPAAAPPPLAKKVAPVTRTAPEPFTPDVTVKTSSPVLMSDPEETFLSIDAIPSDHRSAAHLDQTAPDTALIAATPLLTIAFPQSAAPPPAAAQTRSAPDHVPQAPNDVDLAGPVAGPASHADQVQPDRPGSPDLIVPAVGIPAAPIPAGMAQSSGQLTEIPAIQSELTAPAKTFAVIANDRSPFRARLDPEFWQFQPRSPSTAPTPDVPQLTNQPGASSPPMTVAPVDPPPNGSIIMPEQTATAPRLPADAIAPTVPIKGITGPVLFSKIDDPLVILARTGTLDRPVAPDQPGTPATATPRNPAVPNGANLPPAVTAPAPTDNHLARPVIVIDLKPEIPPKADLQVATSEPLPPAKQPGAILPASADLAKSPNLGSMPPDVLAPPAFPSALLTAIGDPQPVPAQSGKIVIGTSLAQPVVSVVPEPPETSLQPPIIVDPRRPQTKAEYLQTGPRNPASFQDLLPSPAVPTFAATSGHLTNLPPADDTPAVAAPAASASAVQNLPDVPDHPQHQSFAPQPLRETPDLLTASEPTSPPRQSAPGLPVKPDFGLEPVPDISENRTITMHWPTTQPVRQDPQTRPDYIQTDAPATAPTQQPALVVSGSLPQPTLFGLSEPVGLGAAMIPPRQPPQVGLVTSDQVPRAMLAGGQFPAIFADPRIASPVAPATAAPDPHSNSSPNPNDPAGPEAAMTPPRQPQQVATLEADAVTAGPHPEAKAARLSAADQRATLSHPAKHDAVSQGKLRASGLPPDPTRSAPRTEGHATGPSLRNAPVSGSNIEQAATIPVPPVKSANASDPQTDRRANPIPPFVPIGGQSRPEPLSADRAALFDAPQRALTSPLAVPKPPPAVQTLQPSVAFAALPPVSSPPVANGRPAQERPVAIHAPSPLPRRVTATGGHPQPVEMPQPPVQIANAATPAAKDRSHPFRATGHLQLDAAKAALTDPIVSRPKRAAATEPKARIEPVPPVRVDDMAPAQMARPDPTAPSPLHQPAHGPIVPTEGADRPTPPPQPANPENRVLPHALPSALAKAASHARTDDRVEMTLDPVELGKVRFEFSTTSDRMQVNLVVERSETLDLLRRNADALRAEFRDAGFDGASLTFSNWGQGRRDDQPAPAAHFNSFSNDTAPAIPLPTRTRTAAGQGLDLRL